MEEKKCYICKGLIANNTPIIIKEIKVKKNYSKWIFAHKKCYKKLQLNNN